MKHTASDTSSAGAHERRDEKVYSITSASTSHSDELGSREIRYAVSMGIRTLCFIAGVIVWNHVLWLGVVLFVGAVFLPYTSVILANAGVRTKAEGDDLMKPGAYGEIGGAQRREPLPGPSRDRP